MTAREERLQARIQELEAERHSTNEELSRAVERIAELEATAAKVSGFCAQRAEYVTSLRNCHPDNGHDYNRWQGHAEARRQLSQLLGLPVAWPAADKLAPAPRQQEDPHDGPLHHDYAIPHDLPPYDRTNGSSQ